ncbi:MAG: hypothetical protein ACXVBO_21780, partial [Isosphaeraceae bacterium]
PADGRRWQWPDDECSGSALDRPEPGRPLGRRLRAVPLRDDPQPGGSRYVLRSDPLGARLALEPLVGTGTVQLALKKSKATDLRATLVGRDGSAFGLSGSEPATVPVGEYRLSTVTAAFDDPQGEQNWSFIFSDNGGKGDPDGTALARTSRSRSTRSALSIWG